VSNSEGRKQKQHKGTTVNNYKTVFSSQLNYIPFRISNATPSRFGWTVDT